MAGIAAHLGRERSYAGKILGRKIAGSLIRARCDQAGALRILRDPGKACDSEAASNSVTPLKTNSLLKRIIAKNRILMFRFLGSVGT